MGLQTIVGFNYFIAGVVLRVALDDAELSSMGDSTQSFLYALSTGMMLAGGILAVVAGIILLADLSIGDSTESSGESKEASTDEKTT